MEILLDSVEKLKKDPIARIVKKRMNEFSATGEGTEEEIFKELCFCLLTANYSSEGGIRIQEAIGDGFLHLPQAVLVETLKSLGYRFPNARSRYICEARPKMKLFRSILSNPDKASVREWFVENILGLGYKEASHFLRNIGRPDYAIIDFHIIDILTKNKIIEKPRSKSLSKKNYLAIERVLSKIAKRAKTSQGELDLYLWYMETGKIFK